MGVLFLRLCPVSGPCLLELAQLLNRAHSALSKLDHSFLMGYIKRYFLLLDLDNELVKALNPGELAALGWRSLVS